MINTQVQVMKLIYKNNNTKELTSKKALALGWRAELGEENPEENLSEWAEAGEVTELRQTDGRRNRRPEVQSLLWHIRLLSIVIGCPYNSLLRVKGRENSWKGNDFSFFCCSLFGCNAGEREVFEENRVVWNWMIGKTHKQLKWINQIQWTRHRCTSYMCYTIE